MIKIIEWIIIIIHLYLIVKVMLKNSDKFSYFHVILYVFEFFFVIPMIIMNLLGEMEIKSLGYRYIVNNNQVDLIYALFTLIPAIAFYIEIFKYNKENRRNKGNQFINFKYKLGSFNANELVLYILFIGTLVPILAAMISPNPELYFREFAAFHRNGINISVEARQYHNSIMHKALYMAFLSISALWLYYKRDRKIVKSYLSIMIIILTLFSSKRTLGLLLVALVTLIEIIYYKRKNYFRTIIFSGIIIAGYFIFYQSIVKKTVGGGVSSAYEMYIIYFSRVLDVKYVIYSLINPDIVKILDFPGQSYLFNLLFYVPRNLWINKPYPFGVYYTAAWTGQLVDSVTYRYTVSCFSEAIANLGFIGIPIVTWLYLKFVKYIDKFNSTLIRIFGYYLIVYLMITHFQSNINNIIIFIVMINIMKIRKILKRKNQCNIIKY